MKVVVSDYDRTFHTAIEDLKENQRAVKLFREQGNIFVLATGRSYQDFKREADRYQLHYDYVIINHGAMILDQHDQILYHVEIDDSVIESLQRVLRLELCTDSFCCSGKESRLQITDSHLSKIHLEYNDDRTTREVEFDVNTTYEGKLIAYHISDCKLEIVASSVNKAHAISLLADKFHWDVSQIYTIGDGNTDLLMIKTFHGFRMNHSVSALIPYAKGSYDSVFQMIYDIMKQ